MKVAISRKLILDALAKGGAAALSDEAQVDNCTLSMLIKSIRLSVGAKELTVESGTNLIYVKHSIPINEESGIKVSEMGSVVVPAKEFMNFISVQREDAVIGLNLVKLASPEVISVSDGRIGNESDGEENSGKLEVKKIGQLRLVSKCSGESSKTSGKWELDCYEESRFSVVDFEVKKNNHFEINGTRMIDALNSVIFASLDKDYDHLWDSTSIQVYNEELFFVATDGTRVAIYKIPKVDVKDVKATNPLLVPCNLLSQVTKIINKDESLLFSYSEDLNRVFISQSQTNIRLACADKEKAVGFPSLEKLLAKKYKELVELPKFTLLELLNAASLVNKESALFKFSKADGSITVKAISEDGKYKPALKEASADGISDDAMLIWAVKRIAEGMKVIKTDRVQLALPENRKSVRISEVGDEKFQYFVMAIENKRYQSDIDSASKG